MAAWGFVCIWSLEPNVATICKRLHVFIFIRVRLSFLSLSIFLTIDIRWKLRQWPFRHHSGRWRKMESQCKRQARGMMKFASNNWLYSTAEMFAPKPKPKIAIVLAAAFGTFGNDSGRLFRPARTPEDGEGIINVDKHFSTFTPWRWRSWPYIFIFMYLKSCYADNVFVNDDNIFFCLLSAPFSFLFTQIFIVSHGTFISMRASKWAHSTISKSYSISSAHIHMHGNILRFVTFERRMAVVASLLRSWASFRAERQIMEKIHAFNLKYDRFRFDKNCSATVCGDDNRRILSHQEKKEEEKCKQKSHHCHIHPI